MLLDNQEAVKLQEHLMQELAGGSQWVTYNTMQIKYSTEDLYCFAKKDEASEFISNNVSDRDAFSLLPLTHLLMELNQQLYEGKLDRQNTSLPIELKLDTSFRKENHNTFKSIEMNQKNFEYLRDQVKYTGFGEELENQLKEKMQKQSPEFTLSHNAKFNNDTVASTLHFKKSDQSDMYFFNSYDLKLKNGNATDMEQTFYINKGNNITLKEAFNLMEGRAVNKDLSNKEGQAYNAWVQMDFKETDKNGNYKMQQFHQNYGFDLEKALAKHPIKDLNNSQDKSRLIESLQKGNRQSVTFIQNGNEQKYFVEANPQFKTVNVYDSNMKRLDSRQSKDEKQSQGESTSIKQDAQKESQKGGSEDEGPELHRASKKKTKKHNHSVS